MRSPALRSSPLIVSARARLAAVLGDPVAHSLSPRLHNYWFRRYRIDGVYLALRTAARDLAAVLDLLPRLGFLGFNVTVPHKERAFTLLAAHDPAARRMRAVNTIIRREDGSLFGMNTDGLGFRRSLEEAVPDWRPDSGPAVLLGAGGAARAVAVTLLEAGVPELRIANRTPQRAAELASWLADRRVSVVPWRARAEALAGAALLVNATRLGMTGAPPLELSLDLLPEAAIVCDIVYTPLETALLRRARRRGLRTVDGLGMLLHQAVPGFRHWGGREPEVDAGLRSFLLQGLG